jgi:C-terminal processing protease CtpA/Prc
MKSFQDKKAIIVDVSFNFGGYDAAGLTISSYFTDKPVPAYTAYKFQEGVYLKILCLLCIQLKSMPTLNRFMY